MFWCVGQLFYSFNLIAEYKTPESSLQRGYEEAISDFKHNYAVFKSINGEYPLITKEQLKGIYNQYAPWGGWCGTVSGSFNNLALNLKDYGYNAYYVTSYNATLISLIEKKK
jgi:hypothetical protein